MESIMCSGGSWLSLVTLWELGFRGTGANADTLTTTITVSNTISFVSDSEASCLLPAPMTVCQKDLFACNWGKISDLVQFLRIFSPNLGDMDRVLIVATACFSLLIAVGVNLIGLNLYFILHVWLSLRDKHCLPLSFTSSLLRITIGKKP